MASSLLFIKAMRAFRWLVLFILQFSVLCWAGDFALFSNHRRIEGYPFLVRSLKADDVVFFSNGRSFTIDHLLGSGGTTAVYAIKEDQTKALRLPLDYPGMDFLNAYIGAAVYLEKNRIPSVHVSESYDSEYAVVDRLPSFVTFSDFVRTATQSESPGFLTRVGLLTTKNLPLQEMKIRFSEFARKMAFSDVGDMHDKNLVYDFENKKWLLMDWTTAHGTSSQMVGFVQFDIESPLQTLLKPYGFTSGFHFTAKAKKYAWLQDMVEQAHQQIQLERRRGFPIMSCSAIHLP